MPLKPQSVSRFQAYQILGVDPNAVAEAPKISHFVKKMPGGWPRALEYLRASDMPEARHFISKYDNILIPSFVRKVLPVEAFAVAAGLSPTRLWGVIVECGRIFEAQLGSVTAAGRHQEVVEASISAALMPQGVMDRTHQLKHMGFLPLPKGAQVNVQVNANAIAGAKSEVIPAGIIPSPEDTIRRIVESRQARMLGTEQVAVPALPAPQTEIIPFNPLASRDMLLSAPEDDEEDE